MTQSFESLFELARRGDREAIDALLRANLDALRAYVRLTSGDLVRTRESCSDLVQTVCRQVLEDIGSAECRGEAAFRNWLFTVAQHRIANRARFHDAQMRSPARERDIAAADDRLLTAYGTFCTPSRHAIAAEEVQRIEQAMDRLPADYRDIILRARLAGQPTHEIAAELGKSEDAVRHLLSRARARLGVLLLQA